MTREEVKTGTGHCVFSFTVTQQPWRKAVMAVARNIDVSCPPKWMT